MQRKLLDMERAKEVAKQWHAPVPPTAGETVAGFRIFA